MLESLARFDTSKTKRLKIDCYNLPSSDPLYRALLPMKHLRILTLSQYANPDIFTHALDPSTGLLDVAVCPKLKELILDPCAYRKKLNIQGVIGMAVARVLGGAKLRTVRIFCGQDDLDLVDALELRKHARHVKYGPGVGMVSGCDWLGPLNKDLDSWFTCVCKQAGW
jgi:hypothetical protein